MEGFLAAYAFQDVGRSQCPVDTKSEHWNIRSTDNTIHIIKRIEVRTRIVVFTNRQHKRDNGRLSVNSLTVIQIERQTGVLMIGGAKT